MDTKKIFLYAALLLVGWQLWSAWQKDYPRNNVPQVTQQAPSVSGAATATKTDNGKQMLPRTTSPAVKAKAYQPVSPENLIHVYTDVLDIAIDKRGGDIVSAKLLKYAEENHGSDTPFALLQDKKGELYITKNEIMSSGEKTPTAIQFQAEKNEFRMLNGKEILEVVLTGTNKQGVTVRKIITFKKGSYQVHLKYEIDNPTQKPWTGYLFSQFMQNKPAKHSGGMFAISSYAGASISDPESKLYEKISYSKMEKSSLKRNVNGGWIAIQQHYFLTAMIPSSNQVNHFFTYYDNNDIYNVGTISPAFTVAPKQQHTVKMQLYLGPEIADNLKTIAPGLDYTIDYGWLWYLSVAIFWLMKHIYNFVGNWGWSIVLVTILIKALFYKLSSTSYRSMANMRKLQPRMQAIREQYKDDRQKLSMATMELYKKEKINPFGGCWPILIQIPVFIALYWVLLESVELRQAPFIFWIHDLSVADPYYVLPILMGGTMLVQQLLNPAPPDPVQAKMMMLLPLFFTYLFLHFPAGLVLYWVVNNSVSIIQQWYITHKFELESKVIKAHRT